MDFVVDYRARQQPRVQQNNGTMTMIMMMMTMAMTMTMTMTTMMIMMMMVLMMLSQTGPLHWEGPGRRAPSPPPSQVFCPKKLKHARIKVENVFAAR